MNYCGIEFSSLKNGEGVNVVLFVSSCDHHCPGCQNPQTWDPKAGEEFTEETLNILRGELKKDYMTGICFSGGDPLHPNNYNKICEISRKLREEFPGKTQWLYTGYSQKFVSKERPKILETLDVIVTEKYDKNLPGDKWVGSNNQKVIYLKTK